MRMFKNKSLISSDIMAAMAIHDEFIYFIEIDESGKPQRKITVPLADGCIANGQIKSFELLQNAFSEIRRSIGKINIPVCIGLPEGETVIRFPAFPEMSIEDIRGSLNVNFSEYFPFPRDEAVFDIVRIKTPNDTHNGNITVLAVAARSQTVERILIAAHNAGIPAGPVEPLNFAMIRAIPEAYQGLCIIADQHNLVAVWNGDGIFFRTGDNTKNSQDILNTIRYIEAQYRRSVNKIILLGPDFEIFAESDQGSDQSGPRIITETDEYYAARGLAMRDNPGFPALDMRPEEFIEIERRRYSFSIYKLILWALIIVFLMISVGTISFTFFCIQDINDKMALLRDSVADLTPQRIALTRQNSELEQQNTATENVLRFLQEDIPVLEILGDLELVTNAENIDGVKFGNADFSRTSSGGFVVNLNGQAKNESSLLDALRELNADGRYTSIKVPTSQQNEAGQVVFTLILEMGGASNES